MSGLKRFANKMFGDSPTKGETPETDALHRRLVKLSEQPRWIAGKDYCDMRDKAESLERRLREREAEAKELRETVRMQGGPPVPRYLAEIIYAGYAAVFGTEQSLDRMIERGGFGWAEVDYLWKKPAAQKAMLAALDAKEPGRG